MFNYHLFRYFKNLLRNKSFTTINLLGLIIGMTVSLLIFKYIMFEESYDKFHVQGADIYRVRYDKYRDGNLQFKCVGAYAALGPALKADFSEVEEYCRLNPFYEGLTVSKDKNIYRLQNVYFADASFFHMFTFKCLQGDITNSLKDIGTAVISESTAKKFFGDANPIGQTMNAGNGDTDKLTITAVVEDAPQNSHLKFDLLISYSTLVATNNEAETSWDWYDFYTYIKLVKGTDYKQLEAKFPAFVNKYTPERGRQYVLQPLYDIHLSSNYLQELEVNGNKKSIISLAIIAIFILIIAWANFINLSTVVAIERFKEIGIRKTNGAGKSQILIPFFVETLFLNLFCFGASVGLYKLVMPYFIIFSEKNLSIVSINTGIWLVLLAIVVLGALISGAFPAFLMASANPAKAIKGALVKNHKIVNPRKVLVGLQYTISIVLIVCTIIIFKQINYVKNFNLGVDIERTFVVRGPESFANFDEYVNKLSTFKQELSKNPGIKSITASSNVPGIEIMWTSGIRRSNANENSSTIIYIVGIDQNYLGSYGLQLLAGRNFDEKMSADNQNVLLNKSAIGLLNFDKVEEAINQGIWLGGRNYNVVGVIDDYHQRGLKEQTQPIVFRYTPNNSAFYSIKASGNNLSEIVSFVGKEYNSIFPGNSFDFFFLDQSFNNQYKSDIQFGKVLTLFTLLAILICCLGLFGLALYSVKDRIKEIGIRKVNGAKKREILAAFNYEYLICIIVAFIFAAPFAYYFSNKWLQEFAYKTDLSWWVFTLAGFTALSIALLTVSWQSWKAASRNPVEALRYE